METPGFVFRPKTADDDDRAVKGRSRIKLKHVRFHADFFNKNGK